METAEACVGAMPGGVVRSTELIILNWGQRQRNICKKQQLAQSNGQKRGLRARGFSGRTYDGEFIRIEMETKMRDRVVRRKDSLTLDGQLAGACAFYLRNT